MGRHLPDRRGPGRARGPRLPRPLPPRRLPLDNAARRPGLHRDHPPELIPSCVALIAHPDDERYAGLFGTTVTSPLFGVEVPVLAHPAAEIDKGAGIAMCCTFGDLTDVQWWRELRPAHALGHHPQRAHPGRDARVDHLGRGQGAVSASSPRRPPSAREAVVGGAPRVGRPRRRAPADPAQGELLREGREAARDRHVPPVVHPQRPGRRAQRRAHRARAAARLPPGVHAPATRTGWAGSTATG